MEFVRAYFPPGELPFFLHPLRLVPYYSQLLKAKWKKLVEKENNQLFGPLEQLAAAVVIICLAMNMNVLPNHSSPGQSDTGNQNASDNSLDRTPVLEQVFELLSSSSTSAPASVLDWLLLIYSFIKDRMNMQVILIILLALNAVLMLLPPDLRRRLKASWEIFWPPWQDRTASIPHGFNGSTPSAAARDSASRSPQDGGAEMLSRDKVSSVQPVRAERSVKNEQSRAEASKGVGDVSPATTKPSSRSVEATSSRKVTVNDGSPESSTIASKPNASSRSDVRIESTQEAKAETRSRSGVPPTQPIVNDEAKVSKTRGAMSLPIDIPDDRSCEAREKVPDASPEALFRSSSGATGPREPAGSASRSAADKADVLKTRSSRNTIRPEAKIATPESASRSSTIAPSASRSKSSPEKSSSSTLDTSRPSSRSSSRPSSPEASTSTSLSDDPLMAGDYRPLKSAMKKSKKKPRQKKNIHRNYFMTMRGWRPALVPFPHGLHPKPYVPRHTLWWDNVPKDADHIMAKPKVPKEPEGLRPGEEVSDPEAVAKTVAKAKAQQEVVGDRKEEKKQEEKVNVGERVLDAVDKKVPGANLSAGSPGTEKARATSSKGERPEARETERAKLMEMEKEKEKSKALQKAEEAKKAREKESARSATAMASSSRPADSAVPKIPPIIPVDVQLQKATWVTQGMLCVLIFYVQEQLSMMLLGFFIWQYMQDKRAQAAAQAAYQTEQARLRAEKQVSSQPPAGSEATKASSRSATTSDPASRSAPDGSRSVRPNDEPRSHATEKSGPSPIETEVSTPKLPPEMSAQLEKLPPEKRAKYEAQMLRKMQQAQGRPATSEKTAEVSKSIDTSLPPEMLAQLDNVPPEKRAKYEARMIQQLQRKQPISVDHENDRGAGIDPDTVLPPEMLAQLENVPPERRAKNEAKMLEKWRRQEAAPEQQKGGTESKDSRIPAPVESHGQGATPGDTSGLSAEGNAMVLPPEMLAQLEKVPPEKRAQNKAKMLQRMKTKAANVSRPAHVGSVADDQVPPLERKSVTGETVALRAPMLPPEMLAQLEKLPREKRAEYEAKMLAKMEKHAQPRREKPTTETDGRRRDANLSGLTVMDTADLQGAANTNEAKSPTAKDERENARPIVRGTSKISTPEEKPKLEQPSPDQSTKRENELLACMRDKKMGDVSSTHPGGGAAADALAAPSVNASNTHSSPKMMPGAGPAPDPTTRTGPAQKASVQNQAAEQSKSRQSDTAAPDDVSRFPPEIQQKLAALPSEKRDRYIRYYAKQMPAKAAGGGARQTGSTAKQESAKLDNAGESGGPGEGTNQQPLTQLEQPTESLSRRDTANADRHALELAKVKRREERLRRAEPARSEQDGATDTAIQPVAIPPEDIRQAVHDESSVSAGGDVDPVLEEGKSHRATLSASCDPSKSAKTEVTKEYQANGREAERRTELERQKALRRLTKQRAAAKPASNTSHKSSIPDSNARDSKVQPALSITVEDVLDEEEQPVNLASMPPIQGPRDKRKTPSSKGCQLSGMHSGRDLNAQRTRGDSEGRQTDIQPGEELRRMRQPSVSTDLSPSSVYSQASYRPQRQRSGNTNDVIAARNALVSSEYQPVRRRRNSSVGEYGVISFNGAEAVEPPASALPYLSGSVGDGHKHDVMLVDASSPIGGPSDLNGDPVPRKKRSKGKEPMSPVDVERHERRQRGPTSTPRTRTKTESRGNTSVSSIKSTERAEQLAKMDPEMRQKHERYMAAKKAAASGRHGEKIEQQVKKEQRLEDLTPEDMEEMQKARETRCLERAKAAKAALGQGSSGLSPIEREAWSEA